MSADALCPHCNSEKIHTERISLPNGRFVKFLPHTVPTFHFAKHKGKSVAEVAKRDPSYLQWSLSESVIRNARLKDAVEAAAR